MKALPNGLGGMENGVLVQEPIETGVKMYKHNMLGEGEVVVETKDLVIINFPGIGEKKILKAYGNLTIVK